MLKPSSVFSQLLLRFSATEVFSIVNFEKLVTK
jgi:hypothetical protein